MPKAGITEDQKAKALKVYADKGTILAASLAIGMSRQTIFVEMKEDKKYGKAMRNAKASYVESLEDVLDGRIRSKTDKASAILLMFKLKKENPDYRDKVEHRVDAEVTIISGVPRPK